ncbi:SLAP domain-containing protein [Companilactobacillus baiquanensis]|uniref:SLAP domain-containing protein n=1 Tax=Companilactobacillus baiquanensis TaxID=2486005 RepID=A0ABW1UVM5_9LACO|nr:SLAP domain-containing protein [Companilactobacillus baiquanensis]
MKKSIAMITTVLAAGTLLTTSMINMPTVQGAKVENKTSKTSKSDVDENGISNSLKAALVKEKYFDNEDEITPDSLAELNPTGFLGLSLVLDNVTDISGLQYATKITGLDLGFNSITDLSPIKDLKLTTLSINNNPDLSDLSPIANMTSLVFLHLEADNVSDISDLKSLTNVNNLRMDQNHVTDFSTLNNLTAIETNLTIDPQSVTEKSMEINKKSFDVDLNDYLSPGGTISDITASLKDNSAEVAIDDSNDAISVSNIKSSDTLTINFTETVNINGTDQVLKMTVTQPYTLGNGSVITKPVTMNVGDKWSDDLGFDSAFDPFGNTLSLDDFDVDTGDLDTSTEGTYSVTYTAKDYPELTGNAQVTVKKDSDNSGNNSGNNNGSNTGDITEIDEMLLTSKKTDSIAIYDASGNKISDKTLNGTTDFTTTNQSVVNGITYYQVGDDQWVKASDVSEYFEYSGTIQTNSDSIKKLTNLNGETSNRGLAQTTDWQSDRYTYIDGQKYYRVSSNEWVEAAQTLEVTPVNGVLKINSEAKLYHDNGNKSDRGLAANSDFVTDKKATINGETMYRVSTNEWVPESLVSLN